MDKSLGLADLPLSIRTANLLENLGLQTVGDLYDQVTSGQLNQVDVLLQPSGSKTAVMQILMGVMGELDDEEVAAFVDGFMKPKAPARPVPPLPAAPEHSWGSLHLFVGPPPAGDAEPARRRERMAALLREVRAAVGDAYGKAGVALQPVGTPPGDAADGSSE